MKLLLCDDQTQAVTVSRGLYLLSRPAALASAAGDATNAAVEVRQHPTNGAWALEIPDSLPLPCHPLVAQQLAEDPSEALAVMGPLLKAGEESKLLALLIASDEIDVAGLLVFVDPTRVLTEEQARTAGWWPPQETR